MKNYRTITLILCILLGLLLGSILQVALASSGKPLDHSEEALAVPEYSRPAPYGQFIVTHNSATITTTESLGTVARTNGYDDFKVVMCDNSGARIITATLYARITSTGNVYTLTNPLTTVAAGTRKAISITQNAPWMSLGLVSSEITGTTATCGIYVQTP